MATTPTNLPIPSEDPRDLKFNAGKIDEVVTSDAHYYTDRFDQRRWTIAGFQYTAEEAIRNYGYITMDSFEDGATLTIPNQTLRYESTGEYYRWDGELPKTVPAGSTPASTGGVGLGAWLSVGDASLRTELNSPIGPTLVQPSKVSYLPDFTGAVLRDLLKKLSDIVSLKDFAIGDGVSDEYAAIMAAYNLAASHGKSLFIPSGVYKFSQKLVFDIPGVFIFGAGMKSTSLQFTGSGIAIEFNDDNPNNGIYAFTGGVSDLEIVGNANSTILLRNLNVNHWTASRINLRESSTTSGVGLKIEGPTGVHLDHIVCSTNAQLMTNRPFSGIWLDADPVGGGRTSCTTIIHPIIEGMMGDGVVMKSCDQTTWLGGTSENNDGNGVTLYDAGQPRINTFIGVGFEGNRGFADIFDAGQMNVFENCYTSVKAYFGVTSLFSELKGGYHQDIVVEGDFCTVHDLKYSFFANGGSINLKENTKRYNVFNAQTGNIVPLNRPGHLLTLSASPFLFTNNYGFPIDVMMDADSSATVTSVYFCEGTDPNVKVDASGSIRLDPGNSLKITYTGTPTFYWMPR